MNAESDASSRQTCESRYQNNSAAGPLGAAVLATLLASGCCLAPLVLVMVGLTGGWMVRLTALGRWQPLFLLVALVAMVLARRRLWKAPACGDGRICATPGVLRAYRTLYLLVAAVLLLNLLLPWVAPWFYD